MTHPHCTESRESSATHLPKLDLPQFSGNPICWRPFWDSFKAAVDTNRSLTGVQKLGYLRAQLQGEARDIITRFQLTNTSYANSVQLLKETFGEPCKQINAHLQALIDLPGPNNSPSSVYQFHDTIQNRICSLAALGQNKDSYGSLLSTILHKKIPGKMKQNMARAHGKWVWTITKLRNLVELAINSRKNQNFII